MSIGQTEAMNILAGIRRKKAKRVALFSTPFGFSLKDAGKCNASQICDVNYVGTYTVNSSINNIIHEWNRKV